MNRINAPYIDNDTLGSLALARIMNILIPNPFVRLICRPWRIKTPPNHPSFHMLCLKLNVIILTHTWYF